MNELCWSCKKKRICDFYDTKMCNTCNHECWYCSSFDRKLKRCNRRKRNGEPAARTENINRLYRTN